MPKPKRGPRLGAGPAHQKLLLANQAKSLFLHGRITTTEAKAKMLQPYAEKLITKAKRGDLHARRLVAAKVPDRDVIAYLFDEIAPRFADRDGGYTRLLKLGPRQGDSAPMALLELVVGADEEAEEVIEERRERRTRGLFGRARRRRAAEREFDFEEQPETSERDVEEALDETVSPEVTADEDAAPPDVGTQPSDADLPEQLDDADAPQDVPS